MKTIELLKERRGGKNSTSFAGRNEGKSVRDTLKLDILDKDAEKYIIHIPEDTTSFNPSFYLGLFYGSIEKLTWKGFISKYRFNLNNILEPLKSIISRNIEECERKAENEYNGLTGLDI